jgi:hypothetical protein
MNFPNDEPMRRAFYAIHCVKAELEESKDAGYVELCSEFVNDLIDAPSHAELRERVVATTKRGLVAGDFLSHIYAMASFPDVVKEPSVGKAIALSRAFAKRSRYGDGSKLPSSETAIRAYVDESRSVAHLWAAFRLHQTFPTREHREILSSAEGIRTFLGIARTLQDFGCSFIPKRAKPRVPLLDASSIWSVSDSVPRLRPPWTRPPSWMVNTIKGYKPRARS